MPLTPLFFLLTTASVINLAAINTLIPENFRPIFALGWRLTSRGLPSQMSFRWLFRQDRLNHLLVKQSHNNKNCNLFLVKIMRQSRSILGHAHFSRRFHNKSASLELQWLFSPRKIQIFPIVAAPKFLRCQVQEQDYRSGTQRPFFHGRASITIYKKLSRWNYHAVSYV